MTIAVDLGRKATKQTKVSRGVTLFPGGGGVQMLIIETHRLCDFPGGGANCLSPSLWIRACDHLTTRN